MKEILKCLAFVCLYLVSVIYPAKAQFHFLRSTIWLANGDSISGWIQEVDLAVKSNRILFKKNEDDKYSVFYTPSDVRAFKIDGGKKYIAYTGTIDSAHVYAVPKYTLINPAGIHDSLFLEPLVLGKVNLYYTMDNRNVKHFFIEEKNKPVEELHYYTLEWTTPGLDVGIFQKVDYHLVERNIYKQQLLTAFSDCNQIFKELADASVHYTKSSLKKWFLMYNGHPCNSK